MMYINTLLHEPRDFAAFQTSGRLTRCTIAKNMQSVECKELTDVFVELPFINKVNHNRCIRY